MHKIFFLIKKKIFFILEKIFFIIINKSLTFFIIIQWQVNKKNIYSMQKNNFLLKKKIFLL